MSKDIVARHANDLVEYPFRRVGSSVTNAFLQGGNAFGSPAVLGVTDNNALTIAGMAGTTALNLGHSGIVTAVTGGLTSTGGDITLQSNGTSGFLTLDAAKSVLVGTVNATTVVIGSSLSAIEISGDVVTIDSIGGAVDLGTTSAVAIGIGHTGIATAITGGDGAGLYTSTFLNPNNTNTSDVLIVRGGTNAGSGANMIDFRRFDGTEIGFIQQASATSVVYTTSSDARLKDNIENYTHGLDLLAQMRVYTFTFISDESKKQHVGFLAQEVRELFPDAVSSDREGEEQYLGVDYGRITPLLVRAVQDLAAQVESLTKKVIELDSVQAPK